MRVWWVNQNQTYEHEVRGGFLWSPKVKRNGNRNPFYDTMTKVMPGDWILSFKDTYLCAVGVAKSRCYSSPKPDFGNAGENWDRDGWMVGVQFFRLSIPVRPKNHIAEIRPALPDRYSPLQANGDGNQTVYLAEVPERLEAVLVSLLERAGNDMSVFRELSRSYQWEEVQRNAKVDSSSAVGAASGESATAEFRKLVLAREPRCRVTGITNRRFLHLRYIKPSTLSTPQERTDPENALVFAPNYATLFVRGAIGVNEKGYVLHSPGVPETDFEKLGLPVSNQLWLGEFTKGQREYLDAHRELVFRR